MGVENKKVKVAFIGAGNMAKEHIKAFASLDDVELAGIYSRTKEKSEALASEFGINGVYESIEDIYQNTKADLAVVTVSVAAMFQVSIQASKYNWNLFLEKPPAIDLQQSLRLQRVLKQNDRKAYVALNRRFLSSSLAAKENLDGSDKPRFIYVQDQQPLVKIRDMNVHPDIVIENWMYANSIHLIDYFSNFCRGEVEQVRILDKWQGVDDTEIVTAYIKYNSGDKGIYECRFKGPGPWAATVSTEDIRWELKPLEKAAYLSEGDRTVHEIEQSEEDKNFKPGFVEQAKQVINAVKGEDNNSPTLEDCIKTMQLINELYKIVPEDDLNKQGSTPPIVKDGTSEVFIPKSSSVTKIIAKRGAKVNIGENVSWQGVIQVSGGELNIGNNSKSRGTDIVCGNAKIIIGTDCLFSWDTNISNTDSHPIYDINTKERINLDKDIIIGNHVWFAKGSSVLKGADIGSNSVVALNSIVTKKMPKNCLIAGSPAKVIKEDIIWSERAIGKDSLNQMIDELEL